jgi:hypothetical protein
MPSVAKSLPFTLKTPGFPQGKTPNTPLKTLSTQLLSLFEEMRRERIPVTAGDIVISRPEAEPSFFLLAQKKKRKICSL